LLPWSCLPNPHNLSTLNLPIAQCRPLDSASTLASASQITHLLQKYTKCRSRYILSYPLAKKRLKFKGYSTGELFGVGCLNLVSIDADYEVHGRKDQIVAQRRLKTSYAHRSTAALTTGKPVTLTWYSDSNFTKWDFICCDEQQLPVAKFTLKIWGVRKLGRIKFMGPMAHNQKLQEEIVVTSLTLSYQMAVRTGNILNWPEPSLLVPDTSLRLAARAPGLFLSLPLGNPLRLGNPRLRLLNSLLMELNFNRLSKFWLYRVCGVAFVFRDTILRYTHTIYYRPAAKPKVQLSLIY
jgi:hypothetical protein